MESTNLTGQFLIAMPALNDPNFHQTVTYLCMHNEDGAMGIVINRPLNMDLREVLEHMNIPVTVPEAGDMPVYHGGPVEPERGFVLHTLSQRWDSTLPVEDNVGITTSRDILQAIAQGNGPQHVLVALGYAGWGAGQLEQELADNAWLNGPVDSSILFDLPLEERWRAAAAHMGVDLTLLSGEAGHG